MTTIGTDSPLFPGEPTKHTTSTLRDAWAMADELDGLDGDDIAEALWA